MTTKSSFNRSTFVRQRRTSRGTSPAREKKPAAPAKRSYNARTMYIPTEPRVRRDKPGARRTRQARGSGRGQQYDVSFSLGRTAVRAPALSMPVLDFSNPRLISGLTTLGLAVILVMLWSLSTFSVSSAEVKGNQYIEASEISVKTGILGEPIFKAVPEQIAVNLRSAYPGLAEVTVTARLPNRIIVEVVERTPLIAWYQNDAVTWIDADGMAFVPHGSAPGLVQVSAVGAPRDVETDPELPFYEQRFINPPVVQALINLAPHVPDGMLLVYDPEYGIGWQDPRGWVVQFGQNTQDLQMKLTIYQAMVERFINQGIQPTLISMEYLDAPFYK